MKYLSTAFVVSWLVYFAYLFYLDRQIRRIKRPAIESQPDIYS